MDSLTRVQITTMHEDGTATLRSWPFIDEDQCADLSEWLTEQLGEPEESMWTSDNVDALDHKELPDTVPVFGGLDD